MHTSVPHSVTGTAPVRLLFGNAVTLDHHLSGVSDTTATSGAVEDYIQQLQALQAALVAASQQHQDIWLHSI